MTSLTIGQVSALIAAGTATIQILLPLTIPLVLIAFISKSGKQVTQTAVTWSSLNRLLHSSWWPTIVRSDSGSSAGVAPSVVVATYLTCFVTILVAISAVITPLGLYDAILPSHNTVASFSYAQDPSPMGYGTLPRSDLGFSRVCRFGLFHCPGSISTYVPQRNISVMYAPDGYDVSIPLEIRKLWSSGLEGMARSMSSIFDIEWRSYVKREATSTEFSNRSAYLVGGYRQLQTVFLSDSIQMYEGLIVDTVSGGIGFRNHSVPPAAAYGGTWFEDILFVTPETECVDTNLTIDYQVGQNYLTSQYEPDKILKLIDRGGFADLDSSFEWWHLKNSQDDAQLRNRAYTAAWLNNALTMIYMNLTSRTLRDSHLSFEVSETGKVYVLEDGLSRNSTGATMYQIKKGMIKITWLGEYLTLSNGYSVSTNLLHPNPYHVTRLDFTEAGYICRGSVNSSSKAHISNFAVSSGLFYPPPKPAGRQLNPFDFGKARDNYTQPVYSCASASKATIKTVTFLYNGTGGFDGLQVLQVKDKEYSNSSEKPLWGVEDSGLTYEQITPFWGLVDSKYEHHPNVSTIRQESLWLPGNGYNPTVTTSYDQYMNIPGANFHVIAMNYVYENLGSPFIGASVNMPDYTGDTTFAMYRKWLELSDTPQQAARILNLIWTDIAANAVVGTRGWASQEAEHLSDLHGGNTAKNSLLQITVYQRRILYRLVYAIPAMTLLAITLVILITAIALLLLQRTGIRRMKWFLDQTSLGRNFTALLYPEVSSQQASRKAWLQRDALRMVAVTTDQPHAINGQGFEMENVGFAKSKQSEYASASEQLVTIEGRPSLSM